MDPSATKQRMMYTTKSTKNKSGMIWPVVYAADLAIKKYTRKIAVYNQI